MSKKEIWSIPNIMGYFRILLIPIFMYLYFNATTTKDYYVVAGIVLISTITDFLDGFIARRFNMVTDLGKFIDPVADKLTHAALVVCLASRYSLMIAVIVFMFIKESFMAIMGVIKMKKGKKLNGAMWFGKLCTATLFVVMLVLIVFPNMSIVLADALIGLCLGVMVFAMVMYIPVFRKM